MRLIWKSGCALLLFFVCLVPLAGGAAAPPRADAQGPALAASMDFQQGFGGYTGNTNATLDSWNPYTNSGSPTAAISLRTYASRGAMRFDLSSLPTNAYVTQATLTVYVLDRSNASPITVDAYRLARPWGTRDVTWHVASAGNEWEQVGANDLHLDRAPTRSATVDMSAIATYYELDLTALAREWVHRPGGNHGLLLVATGTSSVYYRLAADGYPTPQFRPKLTIAYSTAAENDFPPAVELVSPAHNSFVNGSVSLNVSVQDDKGIAGVSYLLDGTVLGEVTSPPYTLSWNTTSAALGRHTLRARVRDTAGKTAERSILLNVFRMDGGVLTIGHISDTHVGTPWQGDPPDPDLYRRRFEQAIGELNRVIKPAVIINTGDSTNVGDDVSYALYNQIVSASAIPVRAVPGNHDLADRENFLEYIGKTRLAFDVGPVRFLGFTTKELDAAWLTNQMSSTANRSIAFAHYLLRLPQGSTSLPDFYLMPATERAIIQARLRDYNGLAYFSGHYHAPFTYEDDVSGVGVSGGAALGQKVAYVVATVDDGIFSSNLHYLGDWPLIVITSPQQRYPDGGSASITGTAAIRVKIFGDAAISSVSYAIDGAARAPMTAQGANIWQASWNAGAAAPGLHHIAVQASDAAGRTRQTGINVHVQGPTPTPTPSPTPFARRVNCGGQAYVDSEGYAWEADQEYTVGGWGYTFGASGATAAAIANTVDDPLFQAYRSWSSNSTPAYSFSVPNGRYEVLLRFADPQFTAAGQRRFDVRTQGVTVLAGVDIVQLAGGGARATARTFTVDVTTGVLHLGVIHLGVGDPLIGAVQVRAVSETPGATATLTPTPTRTATQPATTATRTATQPAAATATRTATRTPTATPYLKRVNAGGGAYTDGAGNVWEADRPYTAGDWGYTFGAAGATAAEIGNTSDDPLFQAYRAWSSNSTPAYSFSVPNGRYEVMLLFADPQFTAAGQRRFDVRTQGVTVLAGVDIVQLAGGGARAAARTFTVDVTTGVLHLGVIHLGAGSPLISAVQVRRVN